MLKNINLDEELIFMVTVADRDEDKSILKPFKREHVRFLMASLGVGAANDELLDILGLRKSDKAVIFSIMRISSYKAIKKILLEEFHLEKAGHGIAFTIPISRIGGIKISVPCKEDGEVRYKSMDREFQKECKQELIISVANRGFSDEVMDAARKIAEVGATIINARSLGHKDVEKFLGITISPEKELVLMLTQKEDTKEIMKSILKDAGPHTSAKAIAFSIPVSDVIGLSEQLYYDTKED